MGESNNPVEWAPLRPAGAVHVAAGAHVPNLPVAAAQAPPECLHWQELDCTGADGQPDELGNDQWGDCVPASLLRLAQLSAPYPRKPTTAEAAALYERWAGHPPDESGIQTGPAFDDLAQHGAARTTLGYPDPDPWTPRRFVVMRDGVAPDMNHVKLAISAFRGIQCSIVLPRGGFDWGRGFFTPDAGSGTEGGHSIALVGYDPDGTLRAYTWGGIYPMSESFFRNFAVECNAFPSRWLSPERLATHGLSWDALMAVASSVST